MPNPVTEGLREARAVRRQLGLDPSQPIDPAVVANQLGVVVVRRTLRSAQLSGMHLYYADADVHFVLVNSAQRALRQRFTVAHEIGHSRFDRETVVESLPTTAVAPEEKRANAFAAELLMPERAITRWQPARPWGEDPDDVAQLAVHFGVSYEATAWRLHNATLLDDIERIRAHRDDVKPELRATLRRAGAGETEYPADYTAMIADGVAQGLVSRGRAAELVDLDDEF